MLEYFGAEPPLIKEAEFESWILREDPDWLVLNKPGWVVCHPSKNGPWSSLVGAAREYLGGGTVHLVSRLDRETSGLVVLARNKASSRALQMALQARRVRKTYYAIVKGQLAEAQEVSQALEDDTASAVVVKQRISLSGEGAKAQTTFTPVHSSEAYSLVRAVPHTGRKHQIRVHAAFLGHPVVGDKLYGADEQHYLDFIERGYTPAMAEALPHPRQLLHAARLVFELDDGDLAFEAPFPEDFAGFCTQHLGDEPARLLASAQAAQGAPRRRRRGSSDR